MAKSKVQKIYICNECGAQYSKWQGRCDACGEWNTVEEEVQVIRKEEPKHLGNIKKEMQNENHKPKKLKEIFIEETEIRYNTGNTEFNRVLGGGLVKGSIVLIGAKPGTGKSTLTLQVSDYLSQQYGPILNCSGEESITQTKLRAKRLGITSDNLEIFTETNLEIIEQAINQLKPIAVVIDSIQTLYNPSLDSIPGTVSQIRACVQRILYWAKELGITMILVGQYTKEGELAGPESLMHMVDCVIEMESDEASNLRMMRSSKNRFGNTFELGILEMTEKGLIAIDNPSEYFLGSKQQGVSGSVITATLKGVRPILFELQSLVIPLQQGINGIKDAEGINKRKMNIVAAVLEKMFKMPLGFSNMYTKVSGGLKVDEPTIELALAISLYSSYMNKPIDSEVVILGEVDLAGGVRPVSSVERLVLEAERLGMKKCLLPKKNAEKVKDEVKKIELVGISNIVEAIQSLLG